MPGLPDTETRHSVMTVHNREIADLFEQLADLLEGKDLAGEICSIESGRKCLHRWSRWRGSKLSAQ